jgi:glycosyltransferase involved in cell wall biosynthesis
MRVVHVIPAVAPRYGGPSHAVVGMGRVLPRYGVHVLIASTDADGPDRLHVESGVRTSWQGVPAIFFARQWSEAFKYSRPLARWLADHVADFDVVHIHAVFSHACLAAAQACRNAQVPYVVRPLGTLDPWSLGQKRIRKQVLWHAGVKRMLSGAAAIHYTTRSEQRLAEGPLGLHRGVVIPLGVDDDLFTDVPCESRLTGGDPYVLALGRLHHKKGLELLLDSFLDAAPRMRHPRWKLVVAGDGEPEYVASLKARACQRGDTERVLFTGWLGGADKRVALQGAALLALQSHQENFGVVVAEALACGTPVLVSDQVNLADEITAAEAGWVAPIERRALQQTLADALGSEEERIRRGAAGRALARARFTWSAVARQLASLYAAVARKG